MPSNPLTQKFGLSSTVDINFRFHRLVSTPYLLGRGGGTKLEKNIAQRHFLHPLVAPVVRFKKIVELPTCVSMFVLAN